LTNDSISLLLEKEDIISSWVDKLMLNRFQNTLLNYQILPCT